MIQQTIQRRMQLSGVGLQTGKQQKIIINPEREHYGIRFEIGEYNFPAHFDYVTSTTPSVTLGLNGTRVKTVEHLLSVLNGLRIHNARIEVYGDEIPEDTGNFAKKLYPLIKKQTLPSCTYGFQYTTYWSEESTIQTFPNNQLLVSCSFEPVFTNVKQNISLLLSPDAYMKEVAWARTFCTKEYLLGLKKQGLAQGVNHENCLVLQGEKVGHKELVRHKILDFLGDIYLMGIPVSGHFIITNPSHNFINEYLNNLFRRSKNEENSESKWCGLRTVSNDEGDYSREQLRDCKYCAI